MRILLFVVLAKVLAYSC